MKQLFTLVLLVLLGASIFAQAPDTLWSNLYGDRAGWDGYDQIYGATATWDGGFAINGYSTTNGDTIKGDQWVVKINADGDTLWTKTFGAFDRRDYGRDILESYDSCLIICGHGRIANTTEDYRILLFKADSLGNQIWAKDYVGANGFSTEAIVQTADSGYAVVGWTDDMDVFLFRADSLGDSVWAQTYGGVDNDMGYDLCQTNDGGFMIVGSTESYGAGSWDIWIIKTDAAGDTVWTRTIGGDGYETGRAIAKTHDGHYMIAGSGIQVNTDVFLTKIQENGDTLWTKWAGQDAGNDAPLGITATADNGFLIAGKNYSLVTGDNDMYILKIDAAGDTLWSYSCSFNAHDEAHVALEAATGKTYLFGTRASSSSGSYRDYWVYAFDNAVDVSEGSQENLPKVYYLSNNYPNPFNPATTIDYRLPERGHVSIEVYNVLGQKIATLVDQEQPAGEHTTFWNGKTSYGQTVATGLYLYRLQAGDHVETKKMLLLK